MLTINFLSRKYSVLTEIYIDVHHFSRINLFWNALVSSNILIEILSSVSSYEHLPNSLIPNNKSLIASIQISISKQQSNTRMKSIHDHFIISPYNGALNGSNFQILLELKCERWCFIVETCKSVCYKSFFHHSLSHWRGRCMLAVAVEVRGPKKTSIAQLHYNRHVPHKRNDTFESKIKYCWLTWVTILATYIRKTGICYIN